MVTTLVLLAGILLVAWLVMVYHPAFGGKSDKAGIFPQSKNFHRGKFVNPIPTSLDMNPKSLASLLRDALRGNPRRRPKGPLPAIPLKEGEGSRGARITWLGHSSVLVELDKKTILLDPMFGKTPSPFPPIGGKRYAVELPITVASLSRIDAVLLSHDHFDHLDHGTILQLKDRVSRFFVPLGVGGHLLRWGVAREKICELDWWEEEEFLGIRLVCTPARHFSGRSLLDRNATLWCSWAILGREARVYFSGDGGYGPHFGLIGEAYGPFDATLIECGQYDERWAAVHMLPEQTVQAHLDVKGKMLVPIHWAAFTLGFHPWNEPPERAGKAARELGVAMATPRIGESVGIGGDYPESPWWRLD